jgi:threonine/homoserine/homoserine lactone efflux protein
MLGIHDLWLFLLTGFIVNLTPGADTLYVVTRSAQGGFRAGLAGALGIGAGCMCHALAAALGVAAILAASATAFEVVKWIGAAYLVWLGIGMMRSAFKTAQNSEKPSPSIDAPFQTEMAGNPRQYWGIKNRPFLRIFGQGLLTNLLNPKVGLFFMAFVPQFVDASAGTPLAAFLTLGALFNATGVSWLLVVAFVVSRYKHRVPGVATRWLQGLGGVLFIALAGRLALARSS